MRSFPCRAKLLPPRVKTQEEQAGHSMRNLRRLSDPLNQYMYMIELLERNEKLFYKLLAENTEELMPIVYTPTVGLACQKFGLEELRLALRKAMMCRQSFTALRCSACL